jgi:hypothetical protein
LVLLNRLKVGGGDGNVIISNNTFGNNRAVIYGNDDTAENYGTITITDNTFQGLNSYWFKTTPASMTVTGNIGINGETQTPAQLTRFVHPADDRFVMGIDAISESNAATSIKAAIALASDGDKIGVLPGTYQGANNRDINGDNTKALTIVGLSGAASTIIDCQNAASGFGFSTAKAGTVVDGFTIINGSRYNGGGVYITDVSPTIQNVIMDSCSGTTGNGGGLYTTNSTSLIQNIEIKNCTANKGGGLAINTGSPRITQSSIHDNTSVAEGGGVKMGGQPRLIIV